MRTPIRVVASVLIALSLACATALTPSTRATRTEAPREPAARVLAAAQKAIAAKDYEAALAPLAKALSGGKLNESERALVLGTRAYVCTLQKSYPQGIASYEEALALGALGDADTDLYAFNLGQLYIATQAYDEALRVLEPLAARQSPPTPEVQMGLANAWWGKGDSARALPLAEAAVNARPNAPESWLRVLASLQLEQGRPRDAALLLEQGIAEGRVAPSQKTLDALATAWFKAGDPAQAEAVLRRAAAAAPDGRADLRLGKLLVEEKKWAPAADALESALQKGGLDDPATAQLLLGIARFEQGQLGPARAALEKAAASDKTRAEAREWLEEVDARE